MTGRSVSTSESLLWVNIATFANVQTAGGVRLYVETGPALATLRAGANISR
jgi:hypothetical protein